ncbi:MAG: hypothetical protein Q9180_001503 [Flavoplaca navasiana]
MAKVKYIPPQTDPLAGSSVSSLQNSPLMLILRDLRVLSSNLRYLPYILLPLQSQSIDDELNPFRAGAWVLLLQGLLFIVQFTLLTLLLPALLFFPGVLFSFFVLASLCLLYIVLKPLDGPRIVHSTAGCTAEMQASQHHDERWIFINGCVVGHPILRQNIDRLSKLFGRKITGIHNRTDGTFGDLLDCLLQRCLDYKSSGVRASYRHIKADLLDPDVRKVVLIGHSQGGIILSLVIDQLFAELPVACMSKIEIYTFGSAASHFSNPLIEAPRASPSRVKALDGELDEEHPSPRHVISHIEHYANEYDLVCRWGTLHCTGGDLNNRYAGSVFVRMGATGHMMNQHYLDFMFSIPGEPEPACAEAFLDSTLITDEALAMKREEVATSTARGPQNAKSGREASKYCVGQGIHNRQTVKDVSRLWRYQKGQSP